MRLRQVSDGVRVTYGMLEPIPGEFDEYVEMPGVFLASPPRRLPVRRDPVVGQKRYETWVDEEGRLMGRWTWERV